MATDTVRYHLITVYSSTEDDTTDMISHMQNNEIYFYTAPYPPERITEAKEPLLSWGWGVSDEIKTEITFPCIIFKDRRYENIEDNIFLDITMFAQNVADLPTDFIEKAEKV